MNDSVDEIDRLCIDGLDSVAPGENCDACISIEGAKMKVKLDTGVQTCVMLLSLFNKLPKKPEIWESSAALTAYGGHEATHKGKTDFAKQATKK